MPLKLSGLAGLALWLVGASLTSAQEPPPVTSRAGSIERARDEKAKVLKPEELNPSEKFLKRLQDERWLEKISEGYRGWRAKIGGLATGGGLAFGPEWRNEDLLGGQIHARVSGQLSTRLYQKYTGDLTFPNLARGLVTGTLEGGYRNYAAVDYYGPGLDSYKTGRTNYRLEDTSVQGTMALRATRRLRLGGGLGYMWTNVGPGRRREFASTETVYTPAQVPGLDQQTGFLRYGLVLQYDYRDNPFGPKTGGNYVIQNTWHSDLNLNTYSFRRLDVDLQQYVGIFNNLRRFAFRAKATLTERETGAREVPFYLRPTVGGSDDLRGYRPFRFNDRNALVMNAEYRWEIFSGLDGALFFDAGKVAPRPGLLNFSRLRSAAGFGLRANVRNQTFLRVDVGFSREGFQVWLKFNDAFNWRPFSTSVVHPAY